MKKRLEEVLNFPYNKNCYLIYDNTGDFFVIYKGNWLKVIGTDFYDLLMSFEKGKTSWNFTEKHIKHRFELNRSIWTRLTDEFTETVLDINTVYVDGNKNEL